MAKKKTTDTENTETGEKKEIPKRTIVRAKSAFDWQGLVAKAHEQHWRKLRVTIQIRERILAGKPAAFDAASAMLKARGLEDFVATAEDIADPVEREKHAERVAKYEGLCEFVRREGKPGVWIPSNNVKAGLKENWGVLGLRMQVRGSRGALAEGLFVNGVDGQNTEDRDWVKVGDDITGVMESVAHTVGPSGPVSSIKRNEYVVRPKIAFEIMIANANAVADKISDDELAQTLVHFGEHGLGACRSQGHGKFDIVSVEEVIEN